METFFTDDQTGNLSVNKCRRLEIGDRILAINNRFTMNGATEKANRIVKNTKDLIILLVEFNVIEAPLSRILSVKLTKKR
uniref:Glutamate receptor-interacting protein 1 (inferred by orthology to a human protein) n=1 Tax=Strongyloides venezuelensis TaxID=75913 RepID=A0A0K0FS74_STRVS